MAIDYELNKVILKHVTDSETKYLVPYIPNATVTEVGLVRPDGTTIDIDEDGVLSIVGGGYLTEDELSEIFGSLVTQLDEELADVDVDISE